MKRAAVMILAAVLFLCIGIRIGTRIAESSEKENQSNYEDALLDSYYKGYEDGLNYNGEYSPKGDFGYADGYRQAVEDIRSAISDEVWSAYDAAMEIGTVHGFVSNPDNDPLPTNEEYLQYVEELYKFWNFFEQHRYERYLEYK